MLLRPGVCRSQITESTPGIQLKNDGFNCVYDEWLRLTVGDCNFDLTGYS
jgi:hypothetical protein